MMTEPRPVGLYLHVPFCLKKCPYCDFYSLPLAPGLAEDYTEALLRALRWPGMEALSFDTVYFGGGTPYLLGPERIARLLDALGAKILPGAQITLEANPTDVTAGGLALLRRSGVDRLSMGMQSADEGELAALGRRHTAGEAARAVQLAAEAGFEDLSLDVMLATPGQTRQSLGRTLEFAAALPVSHLSAYLLKIEEGTPFARQHAERLCPGEEETAGLYLFAVRRLEELGFRQYEISNFARNGHVSRHNLKYWRGEEYLGLGPGAHSFLAGRRFFFPRDLAAFLAAEEPFSLAVPDGAGGTLQEAVMLGLRLSEGIDPAALEKRFSAGMAGLRARAGDLCAHGLARWQGGRLALTPEGFLLSNAAIAYLLETLPGPPAAPAG